MRIIKTALEDNRPVEDVVWTNEYCQEPFEKAGLDTVQIYKPLARKNELYKCVNETKVAPWVIYVLKHLQIWST